MKAIDRDELDLWMRERDLMLISNRQFADLTQQLAQARQSTTRLHSARLAVLAYLDECDNGMGTANPELIRAQLDRLDVSAGECDSSTGGRPDPKIHNEGDL